MSDMTMTRAEHMGWCKQRALAEPDPVNMLASMVSDLRKHEETADMATFATLAGSMHAGDVAAMRRFIEGFAE